MVDPLKATSTKAQAIRRALAEHPQATSAELAKIAGCTPSYVRAALRRMDLSTAWDKGRGKGGTRRPKTESEA
jgi:hypothetical protein